MRCVVKMGKEWYTKRSGLPALTEKRAEALVFPTKRHACMMVRILRDRNISATVEPEKERTRCDTVRKGRSV